MRLYGRHLQGTLLCLRKTVGLDNFPFVIGDLVVVVPDYHRLLFAAHGSFLDRSREKHGCFVGAALVEDLLTLRRRDKLQPEKRRVGIFRAIQNTLSFVEANRHRFDKLIGDAVGFVLVHNSENRIKVRTDENRLLSGEHGGEYARVSPRPDGFLGGQLAREIQRLFQTPCRNERRDILGADVEHELPAAKLRLQKALPGVGHFVRRDEFFIVGYNLNAASYRHHVAIEAVHHYDRHVEYLLFGHSQDIEFFLKGRVVVVIIIRQVVDVLSFDRARLDLMELAYVSVGAADLFGANIDKGIFLFEARG